MEEALSLEEGIRTRNAQDRASWSFWPTLHVKKILAKLLGPTEIWIVFVSWIISLTLQVKKFLAKPLGPTEIWIAFVSWIFSISIDPLFCYVTVINDHKKSLEINKTLLAVLLILLVVFYFFKFRIYLQQELAGKLNNRRRLFFGLTELITPLLANGLMMSSSINIEASLFSIAMIVFILLYWMSILGIIRSFTSVAQNSVKRAKATFAFKIVLNLLLYLYGGHLFGGLWYLFAVWKKMECWKWNRACRNQSGCSHEHHHFIGNTGADTEIYEEGIFKDAIHSCIVETPKFWKKFLYCFRWGIQNLSGFGQNLQVSTHTWENIFVILITIYGMGTFTYFIGINLQMLTNKRSEEKRQIREEERRKEEQIRQRRMKMETWLPFKNLSENLQNSIMEYQQHNWQLTGEVDVKNLFTNLPKDLQNNVKREFCIEILKKVDKLGEWSEASLLHLCDCVKAVVYAQGTQIVRKGDPTDKMLLVLQGNLWSFSSSKSDGSTNNKYNVSCKARKDIFNKGDFWGEELVNWLQYEPSSSKLPHSDRTVQALTKVEAFVLMAGDLKHMYDQKANVIKSFFRNMVKNKRMHSLTENNRCYCRRRWDQRSLLEDNKRVRNVVCVSA